jgi:hypothetical protein
VTGTSAYLTGEDNGIDEKELAPRALSATQSSPLAAQLCMEQETKASYGWQEVLPRRGPSHSKSPAPTLPPRPMPAWPSGRCCICLTYGHRAALCREPFWCSCCLENGHRARGCHNPWHPFSSLPCLSMPPMSCHGTEHRHALDCSFLAA